MIRLLLRATNKCTVMRFLSAAAAESKTRSGTAVSKEAMLKLRKKTGYSFVNCRKALLKCGENNLVEAEKYLNEVAVKEGWIKAAKLGSRQTLQGQCGIVAERNLAAVVELKCETDFVAKSAPFKQLVSDIAIGVLEYAKSQKIFIRVPTDSSGLKTVDLDLKEVKVLSGKTADEAIATVIGQLGENIMFSQAHLLCSQADVVIYGFSHPKDGNDQVEIGKFVSAVGIKRGENSSAFPTDKLAYQLCQHIIGMCPISLNDVPSSNMPKPESNKSTLENSIDEYATLDDELNAFSDVESTKIDSNESALLRQSFMLNPSQTVSDYLATHGCDIFDFWRFELGKSANKSDGTEV